MAVTTYISITHAHKSDASAALGLPAARPHRQLQLGVSQPALSRTVQQLEEVIGQRLFDRTTRSVALTPTGQELLPIAERLVAEFDSSFGELARFVAGRRGRV